MFVRSLRCYGCHSGYWIFDRIDSFAATVDIPKCEDGSMHMSGTKRFCELKKSIGHVLDAMWA